MVVITFWVEGGEIGEEELEFCGSGEEVGVELGLAPFNWFTVG